MPRPLRMWIGLNEINLYYCIYWSDSTIQNVDWIWSHPPWIAVLIIQKRVFWQLKTMSQGRRSTAFFFLHRADACWCFISLSSDAWRATKVLRFLLWKLGVAFKALTFKYVVARKNLSGRNSFLDSVDESHMPACYLRLHTLLWTWH